MTYFFYDLETSGINPRWQRIMQFAGQRTNQQLQPVGEPINVLVKLSEDVLPEPGAVMVTGITPQQTLQDGISEVEFCRLLEREVFTPNTTMLGFNSIRFDDEFIRNTLFRNFYDPYEREWAEGRSRWDILDAIRMMRALRPDGLNWPIDKDGKPTNRLELLSKENSIAHDDAHDALGDVRVTIELARLMKGNQPKLYDHLLGLRFKRQVEKLLSLDSPKPLVHSSGRFSSENLNTSVILPLCPHPINKNAILVYDLRHSPLEFAELDVAQLVKAAFTPTKELIDENLSRLPVKAIHLNKSPAIAPLGVLDKASQTRINLTLEQIEAHMAELAGLQGFASRVYEAWDSRPPIEPHADAEGQLYDGFINDSDKKQAKQLRTMSETELAAWQPQFSDDRLTAMVLPYKARNYPHILTAEERSLWEQYRKDRLQDSSRGPSLKTYFNELARLAAENTDDNVTFLLQELQLYAQAIVPFENEQLL